jgi:hypothetical protein
MATISQNLDRLKTNHHTPAPKEQLQQSQTQ